MDHLLLIIVVIGLLAGAALPILDWLFCRLLSAVEAMVLRYEQRQKQKE